MESLFSAIDDTIKKIENTVVINHREEYLFFKQFYNNMDNLIQSVLDAQINTSIQKQGVSGQREAIFLLFKPKIFRTAYVVFELLNKGLYAEARVLERVLFEEIKYLGYLLKHPKKMNTFRKGRLDKSKVNAWYSKIESENNFSTIFSSKGKGKRIRQIQNKMVHVSELSLSSLTNTIEGHEIILPYPEYSQHKYLEDLFLLSTVMSYLMYFVLGAFGETIEKLGKTNEINKILAKYHHFTKYASKKMFPVSSSGDEV